MEDSAKNRKNNVINVDLDAETKRLIEESSKRLAEGLGSDRNRLRNDTSNTENDQQFKIDDHNQSNLLNITNDDAVNNINDDQLENQDNNDDAVNNISGDQLENQNQDQDNKEL